MREKTPKPKKFRQNTAVKQHYHPRGLARAVAHNQLALEGATGVNKAPKDGGQSAFAQRWRGVADECVGVRTNGMIRRRTIRKVEA